MCNIYPYWDSGMWHWMKSYFCWNNSMWLLSYSGCVSPSLVQAALAQSDLQNCILWGIKNWQLLFNFKTISVFFLFFFRYFCLIHIAVLLRHSVAHNFLIFFKFNPINSWNKTKILEKYLFSKLKYWAFQFATLFYAINICFD